MEADTSRRCRDGSRVDRARVPKAVDLVDTAGAHSLDRCLVELGRGEVECFDHLYAGMAEHVLAVARGVLGDYGQAEEVAQEVLLEVWRKASSYDPELAGARGWITMIARRRAVDRLRRAVTTALTQQRVEGRAAAADRDYVLEQVEHNHDVQAVRAALDGLTVIQREAIVLAYYGGHTYADVASLLGVPAGTVKTRIRDGLTRLRNDLTDQM